MKKKIGMKLKKMLNVVMIIGILFSSFPFTNLIPQVHALANVDGNKIIETAMTYQDWGYGEVGTCTGLVTRTLNKLGIGTSIVGIHPYNINNPQPDGTGARYSPAAMYTNAMNHPEDAKHIWSGYVKDVKNNAGLFKNGDLVIQRPEDKANYNGSGHVAFIRVYNDKISMYGANGYNYNVGDAVMASGITTGISLMGTSINVNSLDFIHVFRLTESTPIYETLNSTKSANEVVEIRFNKTDFETGKVLSNVEVDFYRDGEKFASGNTDENGNVVVNSVVTFTSTSAPKTYVTNWNELGEEGRAEVDSRGAYHSRLEAQAAADSEAQRKATDDASKTHSFTVVETLTKTKYWLDPDNKTVSDNATGSGSIQLSLSNKRVVGTAYLYKEDADVKYAQNEAEINNALYGLYADENIPDPADGSIIYNKDQEITRVRITEGQAKVEGLYLGNYYWKELTPGVGYSIDNSKIVFELAYSGQDVKIVTSKSTSKENVIVGDFELEKIITSGNESEIVEKEKDAEFLVVAKKYVEKYGSIEEAWKHKDEFTEKEYDKLTTNKSGYAKSKKLAYGTFIVKQIKGKLDTEMVKDSFEFNVKTENQDTIKYIINNRNFTSFVKLEKRDSETNKLITLSNTTFKIKNADTNEYLKQKVANKTYSEWKTDKNGYIQLPLEVTAGNWILEEAESPNYYLINKEGQNFKVTNSNIVEVDEDGDPILTVTMTDKSVKGQIKISKTGEVLTGIERDDNGNTKFVYEEKLLAGMTVNIQANEDIIDPADGSTIYGKGEIVDIITTNDSGEALSKLLPLGKYKVYETTAPNGMIIDTKQYDVNLEFKDNVTEIVMETISITNKRQKVNVNLTKYDEERDITLEGVIFNLIATKDILDYKGNILVKSGDVIEKGITDKDGKYSFKADLPITFDEEKYFEIRESEELVGYYKNDEKISIDTKYKGQNIETISNSEKVYNKPIKNFILINKVDDKTDENIISKDFSFRLCKDLECKEVVGVYDANTEDGTALIPIYFGTWYASEFTAPEGYSISNEIVKIELNENGLFINDNHVETDEDLLYSIKYQDTLLPVVQINEGVQTGYEDNSSLYLAIGSISLAGIVAVVMSLAKRKRRK